MKRIGMFMVCAVCLFVGTGRAQVTFNSATNGEWRDVPYTWGVASYPDAGDTAIINGHDIYTDQSEHIGAATVNGGSLDANSHAFTVDGSLTVTAGGVVRNGGYYLGALVLSNGLLADATFDAVGFVWSGGKITSSLVRANGGQFNAGSSCELVGSVLVNSGVFQQGDTGRIRLYGTSSTISNNGSWVFYGDSQPFESTGEFINRGVFRKASGSGRSDIFVNFTDRSGTLQADSGQLYFQAGTQVPDLSNTTFNVGATGYVDFASGATLRGVMTGSGGGRVRFIDGYFYPTNDCSLNMTDGSLEWIGGRFQDGSFTTVSSMEFTGSDYHWLIGSTWNASGGVVHSASAALSMQNATLNIPAGATYEIQTDGDRINNSTGSRVDLAGTLKKTTSGGTATVETPVYGQGAVINVETGVLQVTGGGSLRDLTVDLENNARLDLSGTISNAVVTGSGNNTIYYDDASSAICGLWALTNVALVMDGYYSSYQLLVTPSVTLAGTNSRFVLVEGQLRDGDITSRIPFEVSAANNGRAMVGCAFHNMTNADFYNAGMTFQNGSWYNESGAVHRVHVDGDIFGSPVNAYYYNHGTLRKTGDGGESTLGAVFVDTGGTIAIETGALKVAAIGNVFQGTRIELASNTAFRMSATTTSNITVTAAGPATLALATYYNQSIQSDLSLSGPVTVQLADQYLYMTGALTGAEASFNWSGGRIVESQITNGLPGLFSGSAVSLIDSSLTLQNDTDQTNMQLSVTRSELINSAGVEYRLHSDGEPLRNTSVGVFRNRGTLRKAAGSGSATTRLQFMDDAGTLAVDEGILSISAPGNEFHGTTVELAAGTALWMAGRVTSNITVTAAGAATVRLAGDGYDQSVHSDIPMTGPVTIELVDNYLMMTGSLTGADGTFRWRGGRLNYCVMTNEVTCLFDGGSSALLLGSVMALQNGALQTNMQVILSSSILRNATGSVYEICSDGEMIRQTGASTFRNEGTLLKTGGEGITEVTSGFANYGGTVGAEIGALRFHTLLDLTNGALQLAFGGTNDYGQVVSVGAVSLGGELNVQLRDGYTPAFGDRFAILWGSSLSGTFSATNLPVLAGDLIWRLVQDGTSVTLSVVDTGDTDGDGLPDSWEIDYFGSITVTSGGTNNYDGDVQTDLQEWIGGSNPTNPASSFGVKAVGGNSEGYVLHWDSITGRFYGVSMRTNLVMGADYEYITNGLDGTGEVMMYTNAIGLGNYYRIHVSD